MRTCVEHVTAVRQHVLHLCDLRVEQGQHLLAKPLRSCHAHIQDLHGQASKRGSHVSRYTSGDACSDGVLLQFSSHCNACCAPLRHLRSPHNGKAHAAKCRSTQSLARPRPHDPRALRMRITHLELFCHVLGDV